MSKLIRMVKAYWFILLLYIFSNPAFSQISEGHFESDGTLFRTQITKPKYVLIEPPYSTKTLTTSEVILRRTVSQNASVDLRVQLINVLFDNRYLVVFSVLPSINSMVPLWDEVSLDSIQSRLLTNSDLKVEAGNRFFNFNHNRNSTISQDFILVKKVKGKYYCSKTDCLTQFFIINNTISTNKWCYELNLKSPLQDIVTYEREYKKKYNEMSPNYVLSNQEYDAYTFRDSSEFPTMNLSKIRNQLNKLIYHFWLKDIWQTHGSNIERGLDRIIYVNGIGVTGASYDFYMPFLESYWLKKLRGNQSHITSKSPFNSAYTGSLQKYLNEDYIKPYSINGKLIEY